MPITVVYPPAGVIGPGFQLEVTGTPIAPPLSHWQWDVAIQQRKPTDEGWALWESSAPYFAGAHTIVQLDGNVFSGGGFQTDVGVKLTITIQDDNLQEVEQLTIPTGWTWDGQANIARVVEISAEENGGLTAQEAQQLLEVHTSTAFDQLLDAITLVELTSGPTSGHQAYPINGVFFGVIVRLTAIPPELVPTTPDNEYWVKTLASVRLFRGSDMWFRVPIHTRTKAIPFAGEGMTPWVSVTTATVQLAGIGVTVDFLDGVFGQVYQMLFP